MTQLQRITSRDVPAIHAIEVESFITPLTKRTIYDYLMCPNRYGIVTKSRGKVIGFLLYTNREGPVIIDRIAVAKSQRRKGIASEMLNAVAPAKKLAVYASAEDIRIHFFLASQGFRAISIKNNYFRDGSTAYLFLRKPLQAAAKSTKGSARS